MQDLLHALLRPRVRDIRAEEFTPSYAGSSTRMDFPLYCVIVRMPRSLAMNLSISTTIDGIPIALLWCVVYDPEHLLPNVEGLKRDLGEPSSNKDGSVEVRFVAL